MVGEVDSHHLTRLLHARCEHIVHLAGSGASAGVVVAYGKDGGIVEDGFAHHYPYVCADLGDTSLADTLTLYQSKILLCCYPNNWKIFIVY